MKIVQRLFAVLLAVALAFACGAAAFAEYDDGGFGEAPSEESSEAGTPEEQGGGARSALLSRESLLEIFKSLFTSTINDFLAGIVNAAIGFVDGLMFDFLTGVFHAENFGNYGDSTVLTAQSLRDVYTFIYAFACALVTLKFIFKGFQIYVLWRNGDADASPRDMAVGTAEAAVVMVAFPWLYERAVDVCIYFAGGVMGRLGVAAFSGRFAGLNPALDVALTGKPDIKSMFPLTLFFALIFFGLLFVLWIKLMRQGLELLVMRLGVPLATLGLIDSDMALFKNYFQTLIKTGLTVIVQVTLMSLAFRVIVTFEILNWLAAIALIATAHSTPRLMQQFLAPQAQGGGGIQKAYTAAMIARTAKMLFV